MSYQVRLAPSAVKELDRLEARDRNRVLRALTALSANPRPHGVVKLQGVHELYRLRVGDYRVLYQIRDEVLLVLVVRVGHRRDVYRR